MYTKVWIIVADHCASSAGKTELPMDKYIESLEWFFLLDRPQKKFRTVTSQIDIMPTLLYISNYMISSSGQMWDYS